MAITQTTQDFDETTLAGRAAADRLREIILEKDDGAYLGSQTDLLNLLKVGRVTLQQTARLLEHEGLLSVRRGVNGGYFGRRPSIVDVERAVVTYLRSRQSDYPQTIRLSSVLGAELMRSAALADDAALRADFVELMADFQNVDPEEDDWVRPLETRFSDMLFALAGDPFVELVMRINVRLFFSAPPPMLLPDTATRDEYRRQRMMMIRAILERDWEYGEILARRFNEFVGERLLADGARGR